MVRCGELLKIYSKSKSKLRRSMDQMQSLAISNKDNADIFEVHLLKILMLHFNFNSKYTTPNN